MTKKGFSPLDTGLPRPHPDMPTEVSILYEESAQIYGISPRASLALLRLAVEKLVNQLSGNSKSKLFIQIGTLKKLNLINDTIQEAFDSFRVIGNRAVHPGQILLDDNIDHTKLFFILNYMVDYGIAKPMEKKVFEKGVPPDQKNAIAKRDIKKSKGVASKRSST